MKRSTAAMDKIIGANIRKARGIAGMSQVTLAGHLGITFQQIQKYENAKNRVSAGVLIYIAEALEVSVESLLKDAGIYSRSRPGGAQLGCP